MGEFRKVLWYFSFSFAGCSGRVILPIFENRALFRFDKYRPPPRTIAANVNLIVKQNPLTLKMSQNLEHCM